jgi:ABC-type transport system involved in cytochrome c biogenesis ATPase subunit
MGESAAGLLERAGELERLHDRLREARSGAGSLVLIEGPAGIGKTSMLQAARAFAREDGLEVRSSRAGLWSASSHGTWCGSFSPA